MNKLIAKRRAMSGLYIYEIQTPMTIKTYQVYCNEHGRWVWKHINDRPADTTYATHFAAEFAMYQELEITT